MIRACLFDLDGTLLPLDTDRFIEVYMRELAPYVAHVIPPDQLIPSIWRATKAMIEDKDPEKTNEEVFRHHFLSLTGLEKESIWPLFEQFYRERFPQAEKARSSPPIWPGRWCRRPWIGGAAWWSPPTRCFRGWPFRSGCAGRGWMICPSSG